MRNVWYLSFLQTWLAFQHLSAAGPCMCLSFRFHVSVQTRLSLNIMTDRSVINVIIFIILFCIPFNTQVYVLI